MITKTFTYTSFIFNEADFEYQKSIILNPSEKLRVTFFALNPEKAHDIKEEFLKKIP